MDTINLGEAGLIIHCAGIVLITSLFLFMTRSIRRTFLDYWTAGWMCMSVALLSMAFAPRPGGLFKPNLALYYFGEYTFGLLMIGGCRNYAAGKSLERRDWAWVLAGAAVALGLVLLRFRFAFALHSGIMMAVFAMAVGSLEPSRRRLRSPGLSVMTFALALLALAFLHIVGAMTYVAAFHGRLPAGYLQYASVLNLIFEILLGFGSLMLVMDSARLEVEATNRELRAAHDRLEKQARLDPLTEALNRHAFYSLVGKRQGRAAEAGCAIVLDIDNLKPINDSLGHTAGDAAIREVARAVRGAIRADDLLFRWGGDEFLILLFNLDEKEARHRVADIDSRLATTNQPAGNRALRVSYGVASFSKTSDLERAIDAADAAMYASKQERKRGRAAG